MTTTPDLLKLARDALADLIGACKQAKVDLTAGIRDGDPVHPVSASLTWPLATAINALAAIDALPASVPSREPAATLYVEVRECPECQHVGINDDDGTAACTCCDWHGPSPTEDHCPGCGSDGTMTAACSKCGHRATLLASATLPVCGAAPTAQAAPAPAPLPDAQALQQARWEGIQSVQVQTAEIVRAALELLDSVGEGLPPDSLAAFKRVFGGAAPAVAAPEPLTPLQSCEWTNCPTRVGNVCCHDRAAPTTQEQR